MGVTWVGDTLTVAVDRSLAGKKEQVVSSILDILVEVSEVGAQRMANIIETTPSSIRPGKSDRVDTGLMLNSVSISDMRKISKDQYQTEFGWVDLVEDYFLTQEHGGFSRGLRVGNRMISPMHALTGAFIEAREDLYRRVKSEWG